MLTRAIVRPPAATFSRGITSAKLGEPDLDRALAQHAEYCAALESCGLTVISLEPDASFPDSTFVEDTAVLTERVAVLARPGAPSRRGEVASIWNALSTFFEECVEVTAPGTLDGGDVCQAAEHFFIGISDRTNEVGARQLGDALARQGFGSTTVDIRGVRELLHLKSGLSCVGERCLVTTQALSRHPAFSGFETVVVDADEAYAANCVRVNDHLLLARGYPRVEEALGRRGYTVLTLDMSEFRKMDGGLSCLSLRF